MSDAAASTDGDASSWAGTRALIRAAGPTVPIEGHWTLRIVGVDRAVELELEGKMGDEENSRVTLKASGCNSLGAPCGESMQKDRRWIVFGVDAAQKLDIDGQLHIAFDIRTDAAGCEQVCLSQTLTVAVPYREPIWEALARGGVERGEVDLERVADSGAKELARLRPDARVTVETDGEHVFVRMERRAGVGSLRFGLEGVLGKEAGDEHEALENLVAHALERYDDASWNRRDERLPQKTAVTLLPKSRRWLEEERELAEGHAGRRPVVETLGPGLEDGVVAYMIDTPRAMRSLHEDEREALGVEARELRDLALANLWRMHEVVRYEHVGSGVYLITCGGNYEAAFAFASEVWKRVDPLLSGARIVAIPARDLLLVTGEDNAAGLELMTRWASRVEPSSPYAISPQLMRWNGERYEAFP